MSRNHYLYHIKSIVLLNNVFINGFTIISFVIEKYHVIEDFNSNHINEIKYNIKISKRNKKRTVHLNFLKNKYSFENSTKWNHLKLKIEDSLSVPSYSLLFISAFYHGKKINSIKKSFFARAQNLFKKKKLKFECHKN